MGSRTGKQLHSTKQANPVSDHFTPSDHSMNQRAVLSPLKAYFKSLRGILSAGSLLFELECNDVWRSVHFCSVFALLCSEWHSCQTPSFAFFMTYVCVCFSVDLMSYMTKFQWDKAKYPTALPLSSLADIINKVWTNENESNNKWHVNMVVTVKTTLKGYSIRLLLYFQKVVRNKRNS